MRCATVSAARLGSSTRTLTSISGYTSVFSDETALDVIMMAYSGLRSKRFVELCQCRGVNAIGLSGIDARMVEGERNRGIRVREGGKTLIKRIMAFIVGVPLGVISAVKQDTAMDYVSRVFALIGVAMPNFWLGVLTIYGLAYWAGWLPPLGYASLWDDPLLNLQQLVFPAMVLSFSNLGLTARVTRSSMLEVLREDYVRTARAKGLQELVVLGRHTLKNALLPVITISGYQFAGLLGGVIIIESIFVGAGRRILDDPEYSSSRLCCAPGRDSPGGGGHLDLEPDY